MRPLPALLSSLVALFASAIAAGGCSSGSSPKGQLGDFGAAPVSGGGKPTGPLGVPVKVDETLTFEGFPENAVEAGKVRLGDFRDADGSKGIRVLIVTEVSFFCSGCYTETKDLSDRLAGPWANLGVHVVQLVIDDANGTIGQSTVDSAASWRSATGTSWAVAADPAFSFSVEGDNPLPQAIVIDPRTFDVIARFDGYEPAAVNDSVVALAHTNGAP